MSVLFTRRVSLWSQRMSAQERPHREVDGILGGDTELVQDGLEHFTVTILCKPSEQIYGIASLLSRCCVLPQGWARNGVLCMGRGLTGPFLAVVR